MIDFSVGSYCSKLAKIDITHYASNFLNWQQQGYNHPTYGGCDWFTDKITYINNLPLTNNTFMLARRKSKIDWCNCMLVQGSCPGAPAPLNQYVPGCMDDGNMDYSYINNRGTWNFLVQNNTTSSGVVNRPDQTYLSGISYGPAFQGVQALNYNSSATVDDGSCAYPLETSPGAQDGLPYHRWGCMNSTPDPVGGHPDVNGHGTGATYRCNMSQTNPQTPDACVTPCAPNQGYIKDNYDPCANFSCWDTLLTPLYPPHSYFDWNTYASDYNICHTFWDNTNASTYNWFTTYNAPGMWGPFGNEICCTEPDPPQPSNPDITYDFRLCQAAASGGLKIASSDIDPFCNSLGDDWKIGGQYIRYNTSNWDVVGNEQGISPYDLIHQLVYSNIANPNTICVNCFPPQPWAAIPAIINIKIYDVHKNMLGDWDYQFTNTYPVSRCPSGPSGETCFWKQPWLQLVNENFSINPGQIVDLSNHTTGVSYSGPNATSAAYVQVNSNISGKTVDTANIQPCWAGGGLCAPRIPSTHWNPGGVPSPRGNTANLTNHWTGQNLNWDLVTNPFPAALGGIPNPPVSIPHSCNDCAIYNFACHFHWLEPGPLTSTPGDYYYNNPLQTPHPSSIHADYSTCSAACRGGISLNGGGGSEIDSLKFDCGDPTLINTRITYDEDENQEVTIISNENTNLT